MTWFGSDWHSIIHYELWYETNKFALEIPCFQQNTTENQIAPTIEYYLHIEIELVLFLPKSERVSCYPYCN
jgi:hypothetical protein